MLTNNHPLLRHPLLNDKAEQEIVTIPASALSLLVEILTQMSAGKSVSIVSMKKELTTHTNSM